MTSLDNYKWRSDIKRIEKVNETEFIEYTKNGFATYFKITQYKSYSLYAFQIVNENMEGNWSGMFKVDGDGCSIHFIEDVKSNHFLLKMILPIFIRRQQKRYVRDLKMELKEK